MVPLSVRITTRYLGHAVCVETINAAYVDLPQADDIDASLNVTPYTLLIELSIVGVSFHVALPTLC